MTKLQMLEKFNEITNCWTGSGILIGDYWIIESYSKKLNKKECKKLLDLALDGYTEFRIYPECGYALDEKYNRIYAYNKYINVNRG